MAVRLQGRNARLAASGLIGASTVFTVFALVQKGLPYPYNIQASTTFGQAREAMLAHPASAGVHVSLLASADSMMTSAMRLREIRSAVWLDPDPSNRDTEAQMLFEAGRRAEGLEQIKQSVFNSPVISTHPYLDSQAIASLPQAQEEAVESGFREAIAAHYAGAVEGPAAIYDADSRFSDEAQLYAGAAGESHTGDERAQYSIAAAEAALKNKNGALAETLLRRAIQSAPSEAAAYQDLVVQVYGPDRDLKTAAFAVREGITNGADPVLLYTALSDAAKMSGNRTLAEGSLLRALRCDPSFPMMMRVAQFYMDSSQFYRAVSMLQNATEINPASANAFYLLGVAEERAYQYFDADKAHAAAARLAPRQFRGPYAEFCHRVDAAGANS